MNSHDLGFGTRTATSSADTLVAAPVEIPLEFAPKLDLYRLMPVDTKEAYMAETLGAIYDLRKAVETMTVNINNLDKHFQGRVNSYAEQTPKSRSDDQLLGAYARASKSAADMENAAMSSIRSLKTLSDSAARGKVFFDLAIAQQAYQKTHWLKATSMWLLKTIIMVIGVTVVVNLTKDVAWLNVTSIGLTR